MRCGCLRRVRLRLAMLIAAAGFAVAPAAAGVDGFERILLEVSVNAQAQGVSLLLRTDDGFHADGATLSAWRLEAPAAAGVEFDGIVYYPLDQFPGIELRFEPSLLRLDIDLPAELLPATRRSLARPSARPDRLNSVGGFLDYDLAFTRHSRGEQGSLSALLQPTVFSNRGSFSSDLLYNSPGSNYGVPGGGWVRLQTAWTHDDPSRMRSLRFGDAVTGSSTWARSLRFGGFQIASNFGTRPGEVTFPQPTISGTAALPSTLDIYVNGQMRSRLEVPDGAFEINDIPVVTGAGQVQVVARDLLGREQIIATDFYASERLLRPGLNEYSISVGRLRRNFAYRSSDYGEALLSGMLRRGISERLTLSGQFDASEGLQVVGGSLARTFGVAGLTSFALAHSEGQIEGLAAGPDSGGLWLIGHQYQGRRFRADLRVQGTTPGFAQPGLDLAQAWPRRQLTLATGINLHRQGSLGMAWVRERAHAGGGREISSLSYSRSLPQGLLLAVVVSRVEIEAAHTEASLALSRSLGPRASTAISYSRHAEGRRARIDHRYDLPAGPGFGYRTSIETGVQAGAEAELLINRDFAWYSAEYRGHDGEGALRLQSRGSIARYGGAWFTARSIDDGFAVIDTGGLDDVRVYLENRPIGATRDDGRLLVPGLRPYEINRLRIETGDIPIWIQIDEPELAVTPYYRAGTLASFGVRRSSSVLLRVLGPDGLPLPEGARARTGQGEFDQPVGLNGRLYLEAVAPGDRVEVMSRGRRCEFTLPEFAVDAALASLGDIDCRPGAALSPPAAGAGR